MTRNDDYPVLSGGTFFTLILHARKARSGKKTRFDGSSDGLSQPETLAGLVRVLYPEYRNPSSEGTFKKDVTNYKSCNDEGNNLSFLDEHRVSAYDMRVRDDYSTALAAMSDFVDRFLEVGSSIEKEVWLIKALLELIDRDRSIDDSDEFYICENGATMTKAAIREETSFCFQAFLLGVWHFVVVHRQGKNALGKETHDIWCPSNGQKERKYTGNMGESIVRTLKITTLEEIFTEKYEPAVDEPTVEYGEPFTADWTEEAYEEETYEKTASQVVNNPNVFNQFGNNNIQIGAISTLTINNG